jgi:hypothetical protein
MRVEGVWWFVLAPMLAFFLFPFVPLPDNLFLSTLIVVVAVVLAYYVALRIFVRLVVIKDA